MDFKRHIINFGRGNTVRLTIDFEPVIVSFNDDQIQEIYRRDPHNCFGQRGIFFWESVIELCCEVLNKEQRSVETLRKDLSGEEYRIGNSLFCYEFIADSGGFHKAYFQRTKLYNFTNFFKWRELSFRDSRKHLYSESDRETHSFFRDHYYRNWELLIKQGLSSRSSYYSPDFKTIDNICKSISKIGKNEKQNRRKLVRSSV